MDNGTETRSLLADIPGWLSMAGGAVVTGLAFAFTTGKKLQLIEQHAKDLAAIADDLRAINAKLDHVVSGLALVGTADARRESQIEALRRDVDWLEQAE